jgi:hypothetical protein
MSNSYRMHKPRLLLFAALLAVSAIAQMSNDVGAGPNARAQAAADEVRSVAGADAAFLPAATFKVPDPGGDLAAFIQYGTEEIVVVSLTGKQLLEGLERSVSTYPDTNNAFLQLSGIEVVFSASASGASRVIEAKVDGTAIDPGKSYSVAMPASLARGAVGYWKVWDKSQITKSTGVTLEAALKGKTGAVRSPRYVAR